MDMDFTSEQELLRESLRRTCERHCPPAVVRELENDPVGYSPTLWSALAELGVLGVTIDEEHGGAGMTLLDAAVVYEELGRSLVPTPHFVSCVLSAGLIRRSGDAAMAAQWLPRIASGETILTLAWLEPHRGYGPEGIAATARRTTDGFVLDGVKRHVPFARAADALLVLARSEEGIVLLAVDPNAEGVALSQDLTIASDTQFTVTFTGVALPEAMLMIGADRAWPALHDTMLDGAILVAAAAVGGARAALELAVDYCKTRQQFDRPLGAFQALAHYLADAVAQVDGAQTLVWEAAWARSEGKSVARLAPMAKSYACRTYRDVTATAVQIFGGVGFTVDFDIQLYFRRAKSLQLNWWDDRHLDELIATEVLAG
jgi:alkylation response protein AidB-like acyl-CoA dehydrogenase